MPDEPSALSPAHWRDGLQHAARVRAARAFRDASQADMAQLLGVSVTTYKRLERGTRVPSLDEQYAIADYCGVPLAFLQTGFDAPEDDDARREEAAALLASLHSRFRGLQDEVIAAVTTRRGPARKPRRNGRGAGGRPAGGPQTHTA